MTTNIYAKLAAARRQFHSLELKKTGRNKFANYNYFELGDFLIPAMECLYDNGLVTLPVDFGTEFACMTLAEIEGGASLAFSSPMVTAAYTYTKDDGDTVMVVEQGAALKGCHPIQNLGAVETYQRRYLWVALMEIVEHDALDSAEPLKPTVKRTVVKQEAPVTTTTSTPEPVITAASGTAGTATTINSDFGISNDEEAREFTNQMIYAVSKDHSNTMEDLIGYWQENSNVINFLSKQYPEQYQRLKAMFTETKATIMENN